MFLSGVNDDFGVLPKWDSSSDERFLKSAPREFARHVLSVKGVPKGDHLCVYLGHYAFILALLHSAHCNATRALYFDKIHLNVIILGTLLALV